MKTNEDECYDCGCMLYKSCETKKQKKEEENDFRIQEKGRREVSGSCKPE